MKRVLSILGPGLLVAAAGIGAGDLATASFAGSHLGTAVLWSVVLGAFMKFVVTEGLARWQLASGTTLLEGVIGRFGRLPGWIFLAYLLAWSFFVGAALMSACGAAFHALIPVFGDAQTGKVVFGLLSSLLGLSLVWGGGYRLFATVMKVCIVFMVITVLVTAVLLWPGTGEVINGLFVPTIPRADQDGLGWTVALMGGVGGTVTVLCYGYWILEEGRDSKEDLGACRLDLAAAYAITALFGVAMVIIGSTIEVEGRGAALLVTLSERLSETLGPTGKWFFLAGAASAVFSSLLGVWQAVPYLFADLWGMLRGGSRSGAVHKPFDTRSLPYRAYLVAIALVPMLGLFHSFREIQKLYAVVGAWFLPALTVSLLLLNGRFNRALPNRPLTIAVLVMVLAFFSWVALRSF